jgi:hypothetical protein
MALYNFTLEQFHIDNTRSRHEDTDVVTFGLQVGSRRFPVQSFSAGDVNNGDHAVNLTFSSVFVGDETARVVFGYQIYNGDASKLPKSLSDMNENLTDKAVDSLLQSPQGDADQASPAGFTDFPPGDPSQPDGGDIDFVNGSWFRPL